MKNIIILIMIIFLISCNLIDKNDNQNKDNQQKSNEEDKIKVDTILLNNQKLLKTLNQSFDNFNGLTNLKGDTIVPFEDFYFKLDLLDINLDGYEDLRVYIFSNTPNYCDNYLFNPKSKTYRKIENCPWDITPIKGTKYFYSYARGGCSDFNWESYLSKIENYKLIELGFINGKGCSSEEEETSKKPEIEIYKINSKTEEQKLIEVLSYKKHIPNFEDKWTFIEKYWYKNNQNF